MCTVRLVEKVNHRHLLPGTNKKVSLSLIKHILDLFKVEKSAFFEKVITL
jgi:hypothetical protein